MLTLVAGKTSPHAPCCAWCAAPRGGASALRRLGGSRTSPHAPCCAGCTAPRGGASGFTLLELLVVIAIIAIATAGASLALRDSAVTALEREAQRLAAVLEAGRSQSRTTGLPLIWQAAEQGFVIVNSLPAEPSATQAWLTAGITAQTANNSPSVLLGPEPIIAAQAITLALGDQRIQLSTDGLRPFRIQNDANLAAAKP
jgi:general secretion pathway protein H